MGTDSNRHCPSFEDGVSCPLGYPAMCRRWDSNPYCRASRTRDSCQLVYSGIECQGWDSNPHCSVPETDDSCPLVYLGVTEIGFEPTHAGFKPAASASWA